MERVAFNYLKLVLFAALFMSATVLTVAETKPNEMKYLVEEVIIQEPSKEIIIEEMVKCKGDGEPCNVIHDPCCNGFVCIMRGNICV